MNVHQAQRGLGLGIPLFSRAPVPLRRHFMNLWHTCPYMVHQAQMGLGTGMPLFGKGLQFTQRGCEFSPLKGGDSLIVISESIIEISAGAQPRAGEQHDKGQAEQGSEF